MLKPDYTAAFQRDIKKLKRKHADLRPLKEVIRLVLEYTADSKEALRRRHRAHTLTGDLNGVLECHIGNAGDWLLLWIRDDGTAMFMRTGAMTNCWADSGFTACFEPADGDLSAAAGRARRSRHRLAAVRDWHRDAVDHAEEEAGKGLGILNLATTLGQAVGPTITSTVKTTTGALRLHSPSPSSWPRAPPCSCCAFRR